MERLHFCPRSVDARAPYAGYFGKKCDFFLCQKSVGSYFYSQLFAFNPSFIVWLCVLLPFYSQLVCVCARACKMFVNYKDKSYFLNTIFTSIILTVNVITSDLYHGRINFKKITQHVSPEILIDILELHEAGNKHLITKAIKHSALGWRRPFWHGSC